jgi:hypothetical protein
VIFFVWSYLGGHGETLQTQVKVNTFATFNWHGAKTILTIRTLGGRRVCMRCICFCWRLCMIIMMVTFTHLNYFWSDYFYWVNLIHWIWFNFRIIWFCVVVEIYLNTKKYSFTSSKCKHNLYLRVVGFLESNFKGGIILT